MNDMEKKKMVVGYVCDSNPFKDKTAWSGLNYKIRESIEKAGCEVVWLNSRPNGKFAKLCRLWNELVHGKSTMFEHTRFFFRLRAKAIDKTMIDQCDVLFFPRGAQVMNYLQCGKPFIYYSDATFRLLCRYYWKPLTKWQHRIGDSLESYAIKNSCINIRASRWAADSVIHDYGYDADHTYVLGFGANLEDADMKPVEPYSGQGRLNILFSGVDWSRKGAEIAIHTVELLNKKGVDVRLYLVGLMSVPKCYQDHPFVVNVGFLNKSFPEQYDKYIQIVQMCHLFLLPTRAECAGIVFGECSAYGIPIYTYDTGGIGDYVFNELNGYRLPITAGPEEFAEKIVSSLSAEKQQSLHEGCLCVYRERLSWNVWSNGFRHILQREFETE